MRAPRRKIRLAGVAAFAAALAAGLLPASASFGQDTPAASGQDPAPESDPAELVHVALVTSFGTITVALDKTHAPLTTANFLRYVDAGRLNGALFYRAMHLGYSDEPTGLLQGGVRDGGKMFPPVPHEATNRTGILHKAGTISMARFAPGTATSDFMILISDMPALDAEKNNAGEDPGAGFAAFGHVVGGMDVVRAIWDMPRSVTKGEGVMKGDILENEVRITAARRVDAPAGEPARTPSAAAAN